MKSNKTLNLNAETGNLQRVWPCFEKEKKRSKEFYLFLFLFCFVQFCTFWVVYFRMHALFNKMHIVPINNIYSKL